MMKSPAKIDYGIQNLKAVLLLGVVVNHAWASSQYIQTPQYPPVAIWSYLSNVLFISGLPVFFFISGYFSPGGNWGFFSPEYRTLLRKKFHGLLVPYLLWNGLFIVLFLIAANYFPRIAQRSESFELNSAQGILSSLLGIGRRPIDAPLWFIRDLMLLFLAMPVWNYLTSRCSVVILVLLTGIGVLVPAVGEWYSNYYAICVFGAGVWARQQKFDLHGLENYSVAAIAVLVAICLLLFLGPMEGGSRKATPQMMCVFNLLVIPCWLSFVRYCGKDSQNWFSRMVTPAAFFIYAAHFLVCSSLIHILAPRIPNSPWKMLILYGIFLVGGGGFLLGCYHLMRRICPRIIGWFIGGRA